MHNHVKNLANVMFNHVKQLAFAHWHIHAHIRTNGPIRAHISTHIYTLLNS